MTTAADLIAAAQPPPSGGSTSTAALLAGAGFTPEQIAQASALQPTSTVRPSTKTERFATGVADPIVGSGQLLQHVLPETESNILRTVSNRVLSDPASAVLPSPLRAALTLPGIALGAASGGKETASTEEVDQAVAEREKAYQAGRTAAGSTGFDWTRTAGNVASPVNYMVPGTGATSVTGRLVGAGLQGAGVASLNPVNQPGNFWGGKLWQAGVGGAMGTLVGGAAEALSKPFSWAVRGVRNLLGQPGQQAADAAAQGVIDQTLNSGGVKSTELPTEMVDGMRAQIRNAMETGGTVDPVALRAQAEAASLPVPIKLSVAQASGDPAKYATEQELAKVQGHGPNPLLQLFGENNQKLIDNLDALGAKGAPTARDAGTQGLTTVARMDQQLTQAKNAAYGAVRDSTGRSATLDADHFYVNATDALKDQMATVTNPTVNATLEDIASGKLPLTVDTMIKLDKAWGRIQRTSSDGNEAYGIGLLRRELSQTPVTSDMGQQAVQAYQVAKGLARQQFELADPKSQSFIPGYASMVKGMGDASHDEFIAALQGGTANLDPEKWFTQSVTNTTPAAAKKLFAFLNQGGDATQPTMQALQHATMGEIRDSVVKGNDAVGRSVFSNSAMSKVMDRSATLREILPSDTVDALGRLYNTSSRISGVPYKSAVNWSNTAAASANMAAIKEGAGTVGRIVAPRGAAALDVATDIGKRRAARQAAQEATQPVYATPGVRSRAAGSAAVSLSALLSGRDQSEQ